MIFHSDLLSESENTLPERWVAEDSKKQLDCISSKIVVVPAALGIPYPPLALKELSAWPIALHQQDG